MEQSNYGHNYHYHCQRHRAYVVDITIIVVVVVNSIVVIMVVIITTVIVDNGENYWRVIHLTRIWRSVILFIMRHIPQSSIGSNKTLIHAVSVNILADIAKKLDLGVQYEYVLDIQRGKHTNWINITEFIQ